MADRVQQVKQLHGPLALPKFGKGPGGPDGGVRVLPAIFAHTRQIAFDVARVAFGVVEGRCKEQDKLVALPDQQPVDRVHGLGRPLRVGGAR